MESGGRRADRALARPLVHLNDPSSGPEPHQEENIWQALNLRVLG